MKYFTISEFIRSEKGISLRIWNGATKEAEDNIKALVAAVLDPLRETFGQAIKVNSGFRNKEINKAVGGASTSQHMLGEAADIVSWSEKARKDADVMKRENQQLGKLIINAGVFDQVIFENVGRNDLLPEWIHVSYKRSGVNRMNILKKVKGTVGYMIVTKRELDA